MGLWPIVGWWATRPPCYMWKHGKRVDWALNILLWHRTSPETTSYYYSTLTIVAWLPVFKEIRKELSRDDHTDYLHLFANAAAHVANEQYKIWQEEYHPVALTSEMMTAL
ncbi:hypothetical protein KAR48_09045 [bacterium]|nr:hypothetical protein [bacterium]